jgi:hypothetical protein
MRHFTNYSEALWRMTVPTCTILISLISLYLIIVGVEDYCCALSQSVTRTHTHTHTHTIDRTPLDEWSARRRDLYPTTRDVHKPGIPAAGKIRTCNSNKWTAQTHDLDRAATGIRLVRVVTLYSEGEASAGLMAHVIASRVFYISSYQFVYRVFAVSCICLFSNLLSQTTEGRLVTIHQYHIQSGDICNIAASYLRSP